MSKHVTETIQYAIRLPNGELADSFSEGRLGGHREELPNHAAAYLWDKSAKAADNIPYIGRKVSEYGLSEIFEQLAKVVEVRVTTRLEIRDIAIDGISDTAAATGPRRWAHAEEVPEGVTVRIEGIDDGYTYTHRGAYFETDPGRNISGCLSEYQVSQAAAGYYLVEVQPDPVMEAEVEGLTIPRRWNSVTEIPVGTRFRYASNIAIYERREDDCLHLSSGSMYGFDRFPTHGQGFVEVLS